MEQTNSRGTKTSRENDKVKAILLKILQLLLYCACGIRLQMT